MGPVSQEQKAKEGQNILKNLIETQTVPDPAPNPHMSFLFGWFFETGFLSVALTVLELAL